MKYRATVVLFLVLAATPGMGEPVDGKDLTAQIAALDTEFFAAFNACDLEKMGKMFAKDLEFYHDIAGVSDYTQTMEATKTNCDRKLGLKREIVEKAMEVYPIPGYGAIQKGKHTFCHMENGENVCGTFDLVHIWKEEEQDWKLTRVVSYGH